MADDDDVLEILAASPRRFDRKACVLDVPDAAAPESGAPDREADTPDRIPAGRPRL